MKKIFNVASIPSRVSNLKQHLDTIYDQADVINVMLNGYETTPSFLNLDKIQIFHTDNSKGDAFKFFMADRYTYDAWFFTCDDDILYPPDYADKMIEAAHRYGDKTILTFHGRNISVPTKTYYHDKKREIHHCLKDAPTDKKVMFGGTGVMLCRTSQLVGLSMDFFEHANMADIWMGKWAKEKGLDIIALSHNQGYIVEMKCKEAICLTHGNNDKVQTDVVNKYFIGKKSIYICITHYNRFEMLKKQIKMLHATKGDMDIEIVVLDDHSDYIAPIDGCKILTSKENNGVLGFWKIFQKIMDLFMEKKADYYMVIADDLELKPDFLTKYVALYDSIDDERKGTLSPFYDNQRRGKPCMTNIPPKQFGDVFLTQWTDCGLICNRFLLEALQFKMDKPKILYVDGNPTSSGVGRTLSRKILSLGYNMYHPKENLVKHGNHESLMNPIERKKHPLIAE